MGKPIDDEHIVDTLSRLLSVIKGTATLKVYQIVGYPWETEDSIKGDIRAMQSLLSKVRAPTFSPGRIMMMFVITPFSPEPLTPMEREPANVRVNWWKDVFSDISYRKVYDSPHLNAFVLPQIPGPLALFRRVAVNRGVAADKLRAVAAAKTLDDAVATIGEDICGRGAGTYVSGVLYAHQG